MHEWLQGSYDGIFYLRHEGAADYRGYVVRVDDSEPAQWFAYRYANGRTEWLAEGSKESVMGALEGASQ
jgi:hypothetical protein